MIIPIHVPASKTQNPYPPLARLGNALFLIEMQGKLEVEGERDGGFVGMLILGDKVRLDFAHEVSYLLLLPRILSGDLIGQSYATNRRTPSRRENSFLTKTAWHPHQAANLWVGPGKHADRVRDHGDRV